MDLILEGLSDEFESIKFGAERDYEISLKETETTMRYMYINRVARHGGSTFFAWKGTQVSYDSVLGLEEEL